MARRGPVRRMVRVQLCRASGEHRADRGAGSKTRMRLRTRWPVRRDGRRCFLCCLSAAWGGRLLGFRARRRLRDVPHSGRDFPLGGVPGRREGMARPAALAAAGARLQGIRRSAASANAGRRVRMAEAAHSRSGRCDRGLVRGGGRLSWIQDPSVRKRLAGVSARWLVGSVGKTLAGVTIVRCVVGRPYRRDTCHGCRVSRRHLGSRVRRGRERERPRPQARCGAGDGIGWARRRHAPQPGKHGIFRRGGAPDLRTGRVACARIRRRAFAATT